MKRLVMPLGLSLLVVCLTAIAQADDPPIAAPDDCRTADPTFFASAPYVGAFGAPFGNWLGAKPCCPPGDPFAIVAGQRCWLSFDRN